MRSKGEEGVQEVKLTGEGNGDDALAPFHRGEGGSGARERWWVSPVMRRVVVIGRG
jgi:hypothetical protein